MKAPISSAGRSGLLPHLCKALAAVNGTIGLGLKGNLCLAAAGSAHSSKELTGTAGCVLSGVAAGFAALGLILEAALGIEFLLTGSEYELFSTLFAN